MKMSNLFCLGLGALLFLGASQLGPPAPNWPTGWRTNFTTNGMSRIPLETVTNDFHWETPTPSKVTIWFAIHPEDDTQISPVIFAMIQTNVWNVTASNALEMVHYRLKSDRFPLGMDRVRITGIWRDE